MYKKRKHTAIRMAIIGATLITTAQFCSCASMAFGSDDSGNIHESITKEALNGTICDANLQLVVKGSGASDLPGAEGAKDPRRHFKTGELSKCLALVDREKRKLINYAQNADTDEKSRARVLFLFGEVLHTLQDFYSRSNYVELKEEQFKNDMYSMDLADWTELDSPDSKIGSKLKFEGFDKSTPSQPESKKSVGDTTYFKVARELALRETQRQWNLIETLIRNKADKRGTDIIVAITKSACSVKVANEILNDPKPELVPDL